MNILQHIKSILLAFFIVCIPQLVSGQYASIQNRFSVDYIKGCTGWQVNVTINDPGGVFQSPKFYYTGFDLNKLPETDLFHTYDSPGEYYLTMFVDNKTGEFENNQLDSILVEVVAPAEPSFIIHNCDDHHVKVQIDDDYYDSYKVNFTATDSEIVNPNSFSNSYDYGAQGDYRIDVQGLFVDASPNCTVLNRGFTSVDKIVDPIITSVETQKNHPKTGNVQMAHTLGENSIYHLYQSDNNSSSFDTLQSVTGAETLIDQLNTTNNYYCFQIKTYDACHDVNIPSNIICTVRFNVKSSDDGNLIEWKTDETQADSYNVIRNDALLQNIADPLVKSFNDTAVICKREYTYNVQTVYTVGSSLALDTAIIASQSGELPPITSYPISSINLENEVVLNWSAPNTGDIPFRQYIVQKNINNRSWRYLATAKDTTYIDDDADFFGTHSYRITYDDDCGNEATPSPFTNPIILKQTAARGKIVSYEWNKYETWTEGIRKYTIERIDSAGNVLEEYPVLSGRQKDIEFAVNDLEEKYIRVRAESLDEEPKFTYSNVIESRLKTQMYLPKAFTPDGDNLNDRFVAKGPAVFDFHMEIYNRWGILIYQTSDLLNGWDGTIKGDKQLEGTYIYKIYFKDGVGKNYNQTGSFLLLRH
ncbi:gliding motility-associated C-terminal domain-containing protein [Reichenbachiella agarivorans]|uniref:Gliding motility-associated C-terminal domain-containing protein n=1 Tax=Reichenbachiella agarivorans TaxID=2979464 RepID=A0ABY6CQM7_9BACT|nr:gliding motility-associated C-terminal domain-containing protein [Reichenbachiella agarivorans]UXP31748.1 gliding motility-associated C-terminal domain-containing protein [Reichenbachiella agarivorans]